MATQSPYIPQPDAEFSAWLLNFATLLVASPTTYGLSNTEANATAAVNTTFQAAYTAAIDPSTRTPVTVQAKNDARAQAEATVRPYAVDISRNPAVQNEDKTAIGVNLPNSIRTPIPAPVTAPNAELVGSMPGVHRLQIRDSATPTTKAKPPGVTGCEIWVNVGTVAATDPAQAALKRISTKTPTQLDYASDQRGKIATYFLRWVTRSGPGGVAQTGPWSAPQTWIIP